METITVIFTVARTHLQIIDTDANFKLSEVQRAFCDMQGNALGDFYNTPLTHDRKYSLFDPDDDTSLRTLAEAAKKLGCEKAMFYSNKIVTLRSSPIDRGTHLDFYKCYFYFDRDNTSQILSDYFIPMNTL
ncbi:hypothetical protein Lepto7375DRAFT_7304 [Leptolyngbya sp. PCC 7375]|nr:hypothetical protein Lepto7375DRAFT_7304 [Leptolyngbya sp. PCC 7375]